VRHINCYNTFFYIYPDTHTNIIKTDLYRHIILKLIYIYLKKKNILDGTSSHVFLLNKSA